MNDPKVHKKATKKRREQMKSRRGEIKQKIDVLTVATIGSTRVLEYWKY